MDGKRLDRVLIAYRDYQRMLEHVQQLQSISEKITTVLSGMPRGGNSKKDDVWAKLIDSKTKCQWLIGEYIKMWDELDEELDCITNMDIRVAMKYYYLNALTQEAIAERMGCSDREIRRRLQTGRNIYNSYYDKEC